MAAAPTRNKEAFYRGLEKLDDLTEGQTSDDDFSHIIAISKRRVRDTDFTNALVPTSSSSSAQLNANLPRASTVPECSSRSEAGPGSASSPGPEEMAPTAKKPALKSAKTTGALSESRAEGPPHKRRRTYAARLIPEQQQIFKGLVFCQYPGAPWAGKTNAELLV